MKQALQECLIMQKGEETLFNLRIQKNELFALTHNEKRSDKYHSPTQESNRL